MWEKVLSPGEEIKYEFGIGKRYITIVSALIILIGIIFLLVGIGLFIILLGIFIYWYLQVAFKFAFTNKRVLAHYGWLSTRLISIDYGKITDVFVDEPFLNRIIYGIGNLGVRTASTDGAFLDRIEKPYEVKKILDDLREAK